MNELVFAFWAWFLLPLDAATPTLAHVRLSGGAFLVLMRYRWARSVAGKRSAWLVWAWALLAVYAAYGALWCIVIAEQLTS